MVVIKRDALTKLESDTPTPSNEGVEDSGKEPSESDNAAVEDGGEPFPF